jgi:hypothetical protein
MKSLLSYEANTSENIVNIQVSHSAAEVGAANAEFSECKG